MMAEELEQGVKGGSIKENPLSRVSHKMIFVANYSISSSTVHLHCGVSASQRGQRDYRIGDGWVRLPH